MADPQGLSNHLRWAMPGTGHNHLVNQDGFTLCLALQEGYAPGPHRPGFGSLIRPGR